MSALARARGAVGRLPRVRGRSSGTGLSPVARRRLWVAAVLAVILTAAYMFWLRDSGLVAVDRVSVSGLSEGRDADRVRAALDAAGRQMTTLHIDEDALQRAADGFPLVRDIRVEPDFPSGLNVTVVEHRPAALLVSGGRRVAVAADGSVLTGLVAEGSLPEIAIAAALPEDSVPPGGALAAVRVAGAAPAALTPRLGEVKRERDRGVVVAVEGGPELIFGDESQIAAKWAAATRVLADPDAAGAEYLDLRIPERPAAGGLEVETVAPAVPAGEVVETPPAPDPVAPVDPAAEAPVAPVEETPTDPQP